MQGSIFLGLYDSSRQTLTIDVVLYSDTYQQILYGNVELQYLCQRSDFRTSAWKPAEVSGDSPTQEVRGSTVKQVRMKCESVQLH